MRTLFFILAGGYGKRTKPLSLVKPKPVFPLDGTPLLKIILKQLKAKGLSRGFINLHHLPEAVRRCAQEAGEKGDIKFLYEEKLSGSQILTGALDHMAADDLLLAVNGDIFLEIPFEGMLKEMLKNDADGLLLVRRNKDGAPGYKEILTEDGFFMGRKEHTGSESAAGSLMYTGVSLFKRNVIPRIHDINFFDSLEKNTLRISVFIYEGIWLDIGDPASYIEANFKYKRYLHKNNEDTGANSLSENVLISADSMVRHSIIWENTEIKNKSVIDNCIVTGNVSLDHAHFENEIVTKERRKNSLYDV